MIRGLYTSSAGMQVEQLKQDAIANNLANLDSTGFKRDMDVIEARPNLSMMRTNNPTSANPLGASQRVAIGPLGTGVFVNRVVKRFEQGALHQTENPLDVGLKGAGFFTLMDNKGKLSYTRCGEFSLDGKGHVVDKSGRYLMGQNGPLSLPNGKVQITTDGTVSINGGRIDKLALAGFSNPDTQLNHMTDTSYTYNGKGTPPVATPEVHQGFVESANVSAIREMVNMIASLRQYEANQKAITKQDETLTQAVNDIAK